jgi:tetratricopeptide (TPR) repeat protein
LLKGDTDSAIVDLNRALEINPELADAYLQRGYAYLRQDRFAAGIEDFSTALELEPEWAEAYFYRAVAWLHLDKEADAYEDYRQAVGCQPEQADGFRLKWLWHGATAKTRLERYDDAVELCNELLQQAPAIGPIHHVRAGANWYAGELVPAGEDYSRLLSNDPNDWQALNGRGQVYAELGEYDLAVADLDRAIEIAHSRGLPATQAAFSLNGRGLARTGLGQFSEALADFERSIALCPGNAWVYYNLGLHYHQQAENRKAATCFKLALQLDGPSLPPRKRRRAKSYIDVGEFEV